MNFSNERYKQITNDNMKLNKIDAFFILINGIKKCDLDNLIAQVSIFFRHIDIDMSDDEIYNILQNPSLIDDNVKTEIVNIAYNIANSEVEFGNNYINEKINTSSWISHSLNVSLFCENMAKILDLDYEKAATLGLLHDYGRKFDHTFNHVIKGYEALTDMGYNKEAQACLTHSFINGGICANNEPAIAGFNLDDQGNVYWDENLVKDDMFEFLENYKYDEYDLLLNLGDLMATSKGITSSYARVVDIATRREIDPKNRTYFFTELYNLLLKFIKALGYGAKANFIKPVKGLSSKEANFLFFSISELFNKTYQMKINELYKNNSKGRML